MRFYSRLTHYDDLIASGPGTLVCGIVALLVFLGSIRFDSNGLLFLSMLLVCYGLGNLILFLKRCRLVRLLRSVCGADASHIIDVGTGSGHLALETAEGLPHASVTGIDLIPDGLEIAKRRANKAGVQGRTRFLQQDLNVTPFLLPPFDHSMALDVLASHRHEDLWRLTLRSLWLAMKEGGFFVTDICNRRFNRRATYAAIVLFLAIGGLLRCYGGCDALASFVGIGAFPLKIVLLFPPLFLLSLNMINGDSLVLLGLGRAQWTREEATRMLQGAGFQGVRFVSVIPFLPTLYLVVAKKRVEEFLQAAA